jgi:hypothetical protein
MTSNEILTLARTKLLETSTAILSDVTLLLYANQAQLDVVKKVYPASAIKTATVTLTAGVGTLPTDFGTLYGNGLDSGSNEYPEVTIEDFSREIEPFAMTVQEGELHVSPDTTASINIKYYKKPAVITISGSPEIDEYFHEPLVYGIVWRAQEDLQDEELATFYRTRFTTDLDDRMKNQSSYEETNQRGGVMFNAQSLI